MSEQPPPGFYDDGSGGRRWWDGEAWTDHATPGQAEKPRASGVTHQGESMTWAATIGLLLAIFLPIVGFFVGLALIASRDRHATMVLVVSIVSGIVFVSLLA